MHIEYIQQLMDCLKKVEITEREFLGGGGRMIVS